MKKISLLAASVLLATTVQAQTVCNTQTGEGCGESERVACDTSNPWDYDCEKCLLPWGTCPGITLQNDEVIPVLFPYWADEMQSWYNDAASSHERCMAHYEANLRNRRVEQWLNGWVGSPN